MKLTKYSVLALGLALTSIGSLRSYASDETSPVTICGTIYRQSGDPAAPETKQVHLKSMDESGMPRFDLELVTFDAEVQSILEKIVFPNDVFIGCASGVDLPSNEGGLTRFAVSQIQLHGQP